MKIKKKILVNQTVFKHQRKNQPPSPGRLGETANHDALAKCMKDFA